MTLHDEDRTAVMVLRARETTLGGTVLSALLLCGTTGHFYVLHRIDTDLNES